MSLAKEAASWLKSIVSNHLPSTARQYTWKTYVNEVTHNNLGGVRFLSPTEAKVVDMNDEFVALKERGATFVVIERKLLSQEVAIGDKIGVSFYKLKRFDGLNPDGSEDSAVGGIRSFMLTGAHTRMPVMWADRHVERMSLGPNVTPIDIRNPYLRDLITQLEQIPVPGQPRKLLNILTDANPSNLSFNDPAEEDSAVDAPAVRLNVATAKHTGGVEISYDRANDTYSVALTPNAGEAMRVEGVHFDQLAEVLLDGIDDGSWITAKVTMIKAAPKKRTSASTVPA